MKKMKKPLALILALVMVAALVSCGSSSGKTEPSGSAGENSSAAETKEDEGGEDEGAGTADPDDGTVYTMRIGTLTVETEQNTALALQFADTIAERSNGRIQVEVYPSAQLGTAAQMIEGMQNGTIEGGLFPTAWGSAAVPMLGSLSVPGFAGNDVYSMTKVINELGGKDIYNEYCKEGGLYMASLLMTDRYTYLLCDHQVESVDDLGNMIIWSPPSEYTSYLVDAFGSSVTFFDTSELAVNVQNRVVDAALASPALFAAQKLYETLPYCIALEGGSGAPAFFMSESFLSGLPEDLRTLVEDTALELTMDFEYEYAETIAQENLATMSDAGTVTTSSDYPELQAGLDEIYASVRQYFFDNVEGGEDFYNSIQALVAQIEE